MKKTKIIIPALAMLLLSTAASVSGTVAWFSMNNSVTVTGMSVTTKVSSNLLIAETNAEANYSDAIVQTRSGILEPVSSINGVAFYYTAKAKGDGSAIPSAADAGATTFTPYSEATNALGTTAKANTGKSYYDATFNSTYGFTTYVADPESGEVCFGYIDYSFYLKATSAVANQDLALTKCNMLYNDLAITSGFSWRVAMFAGTVNENDNSTDVVSAENLKTILDFGAKSKNQNEVEAVDVAVGGTIPENTYYSTPNLTGNAIAASASAEAAGRYYKAKEGETGPKAVNGATASSKAAVLPASPASKVAAALTQNATQRYKVVVRLWLEGEDVSCTSDTFANLALNWKLDLGFELGVSGDGTNNTIKPVTEIGSEVPNNG